MKSSKGGFVFAVLMLASIFVPSALATKSLYTATILPGKDCGDKLGSASLVPNPGDYDFRVDAITEGELASEVWMELADGTPIVPLCGTPDSPIPECTYDDQTGRLDLEGKITSTLFYIYGITGKNFKNWLDRCQIHVVISWKGLPCKSSGRFSKIIPFTIPCP